MPKSTRQSDTVVSPRTRTLTGEGFDFAQTFVRNPVMKDETRTEAMPTRRPVPQHDDDDEATVLESAPRPLRGLTKSKAARAAPVLIAKPTRLERAPRRLRRPSTETMLNDVFLRVARLDACTSVEAAMNLVLDLALEKIPSESAAVLRLSQLTGNLVFIAARGPKAAAVLASKVRVRLGTGIAGTCVERGSTARVNDVRKHPRFSPQVDDRVNHQTRSILCAPMQAEGRTFGCLQLVNRKGTGGFQPQELDLLEYLAKQAATFISRVSP